jgi:hypothetical protein
MGTSPPHPSLHPNRTLPNLSHPSPHRSLPLLIHDLQQFHLGRQLRRRASLSFLRIKMLGIESIQRGRTSGEETAGG